MKQFTSFAFLLLIGVSLFSCQGKDDDRPAPRRGIVRPKGTPDGQLVQKTIGPEGGTLADAGNKITLSVPPGTVSVPTDFSIQPVTNTLPGSPGKAYRLLPEGLDFKKQVTLTFHYDSTDMKNTSSQALFMAFQSEDGIWRFMPETELDEANRTLTVKTTHFSDWAPFAEFFLNPVNAELKPGASTSVLLVGPFYIPPVPGSKDPLEIEDIRPLENPDNIKNWKVYQHGTLSVKGDNKEAIYTAPPKVPPVNPVRISVEVHNFIPPSRQKRKGYTGKATMFCNISILADTYFIGKVDGAEFVLPPHDFGFVREDDVVILHGNFSSTSGVTLTVHPAGSNIQRKYPYSRVNGPGTGVVVLLPGPGTGFLPWYSPCEGDEVVSSGSIEISKHEITGNTEYVTGTFSATVYKSEGVCPHKKITSKTVSGQFRMQHI